jgi:hypothetical protein
VQSSPESLWLHEWLVKEVMRSSSTHRSPLDWLVAHLAASSPSVFLGAVIDDLLDDVMACSANSVGSLAIYVRRIGVLEYAALRYDLMVNFYAMCAVDQDLHESSYLLHYPGE